MRRLTLFLFLFAFPIEAAEVARAGQFELHSSFWQSLHQRLLTARRVENLPDGWRAPVEAYRKAFGLRAPYFDLDIIKTTDALMNVADDADVSGVPEDIAAALRAAAPLYRAGKWSSDDKANRFWIAYAAPMLREGMGDISRELARLYETPWPTGTIRIDAAPFAGPNGAYTTTLTPHIVVSVQDPGYQGLNALEMMMHESSHLSVGLNSPTIGKVIGATVKRLGVPYPDNLWHALLFRTSGEVTRRWLAERGVDYKPVAEAVITEAWPHLKAPLDKHWKAYMDGKMSREAAIEAMVKELGAAAAPK